MGIQAWSDLTAQHMTAVFNGFAAAVVQMKQPAFSVGDKKKKKDLFLK